MANGRIEDEAQYRASIDFLHSRGTKAEDEAV
jgi:hypothetical protein